MMIAVATAIGHVLASCLLMFAFLYVLSITVSAAMWVFGVRLHQRP